MPARSARRRTASRPGSFTWNFATRAASKYAAFVGGMGTASAIAIETDDDLDGRPDGAVEILCESLQRFPSREDVGRRFFADGRQCGDRRASIADENRSVLGPTHLIGAEHQTRAESRADQRLQLIVEGGPGNNPRDGRDVRIELRVLSHHRDHLVALRIAGVLHREPQLRMTHENILQQERASGG